MATLSVEKSSGDVAVTSPDPSWSGLYRAGAVSALLFALLSIGYIGLAAVVPQPPSGGGSGTLAGGVATLNYIAAHQPAYLLNMILFIGPVALSAIVFLALFVALKHLSPSTAAIGAMVGIAGVVLSVATFTLVFGLVPLSAQYQAATTAVQRVAVVTAANGLLAQINAVNIGGFLYAVGVLIISLAMLKGVFSRAVAYLGIVSGVVGIVCESLRPVMGASYGIYGILLIWLVAVGWKLYQLSTRGSDSVVGETVWKRKETKETFMAKIYHVNFATRTRDSLFRTLLRTGVNLGTMSLLTVRGRKSGQPHTVPVRLIEQNSQRFLVAPYGIVQWVRNLRAAGTATLTRGQRSESISVTELPAEEAAPILKEYLVQVATVRPYFDVTRDSNLLAFKHEASHHPVFRIASITSMERPQKEPGLKEAR